MNWLVKTFVSSIGKKQVMAVTGLFFCLFITVHLIGNLTIYAGKESSSPTWTTCTRLRLWSLSRNSASSSSPFFISAWGFICSLKSHGKACCLCGEKERWRPNHRLLDRALHRALILVFVIATSSSSGLWTR